MPCAIGLCDAFTNLCYDVAVRLHCINGFFACATWVSISRIPHSVLHGVYLHSQPLKDRKESRPAICLANPR